MVEKDFSCYKLDGKVAIVTGAGRGIGKGIALILAEAGVDVVVTARTLSQIEQTASEIKQLGQRSLAIQCDVTKEKQIYNAVEKIISEFGKIDILVNNAGTTIVKPAVLTPEMGPPKRLGNRIWDKQLSLEEWQLTLDTNLTSVFMLCQAVIPYMIKQKRGKIVNISSNSVKFASPYFSSYCVSKAAVSSLTSCLASEFAPYNVYVNAIGPGHILTELTSEWHKNEDVTRTLMEQIPLKRLGQPDEVGYLVLYLASELSDYMTGETVFLDGGQQMRGNSGALTQSMK